jgi:Tfp pilus assembly protein PilP
VPAKSSRGPATPFRRLWPLAAALAVGLSACSGDEAPSPPPPPRPAPAPATKAPTAAPAAAPAPTAAPAAAFSYEAKGRRDPFRPLIAPKVATPSKRVRPGLPGLRVAELKLTGIIWGGRGYYALVEAPDGKGYVLRKNDLVGEDADESARVSTIVPDAVTFEVQGVVQTPSARTRVVELRLRKEE